MLSVRRHCGNRCRSLPAEGEGDAAEIFWGDLREAEEIAESGPMKLHQADVHLNRARLRLGWLLRKPEADPEKSRERLVEIRRDFAEARRLIDECGYHRRDPEMADIEAALAAASEGSGRDRFDV